MTDRYAGRARDFYELIKTEPRPKDWLVCDYLVRARHIILAGQAGSSKTMVLWQLGVQMTQDRPDEFPHDLGFRLPQTLKVALVDAEMGPEQYHERTWDTGINGLVIPGRLKYIDAAGLDLMSQGDLDYFMAELEGFDLVLMDSLKALSPRAAENDNDDMAAVTRSVTQMSRELDAGIVTIHHWGKEDAYRGASAILDQCDGLLAWKKNEPNNDDGFRCLSAHGRHTKLRFAKEPADCWFKLLDSGLLMPSDSPGNAPESKWDDEIRKHLPFIGTKTSLAKECGTNLQNKAWSTAYARLVVPDGDKHVLLAPTPGSESPDIG
jgi:hypothetical protein